MDPANPFPLTARAWKYASINFRMSDARLRRYQDLVMHFAFPSAEPEDRLQTLHSFLSQWKDRENTLELIRTIYLIGNSTFKEGPSCTELCLPYLVIHGEPQIILRVVEDLRFQCLQLGLEVKRHVGLDLFERIALHMLGRHALDLEEAKRLASTVYMTPEITRALAFVFGPSWEASAE